MFQAVPYSRDYKRKYEYMKSQLRKPVSFCSIFKIHVFCDAYSASESPYKDVHVSFKGMKNIFLLVNVQSTRFLGERGGS